MSGFGADVAIGIDLGGSKIAAGLVDRSGSVIGSVVERTPAREGADAIVRVLGRLIGQLARSARVGGRQMVGVGVASAGIVSESCEQVMSATEALPGWAGWPIVDQLSEYVDVPVFLVNDVQAMAVGELRFGVGGTFAMALYVAVGTGVGGALAFRETLYRGSHGYAGDIGHVVVDVGKDAPVCGCGRRGHLEAYVSGPALARAYERRTGQEGHADLREVAVEAARGNVDAANVLKEGGVLLGRTLGGIAGLLDPDVIIFGGGLLGLGPLFWPFVESAIANEIRLTNGGPQCRLAGLRDSAAVVGAGTLALEGAFVKR
jgi:glucokinase